MLTRQQLSKFYADRKPYLEEVIGKFEELPAIYPQFLNIKSTTSGWVDTATISGFGTFSSKPELEDAASDDLIQGPTARTTIVTYAKRNAVSQEAIEDERADGIIASRLPLMMRAARTSQEILGHDLINSGFSTIKTPDNVALFSASHINLSGATYSNLGTSADPGAASLEAAIIQLQTMTDDRNMPIFQRPSKLLISPNFEFTMKKVLNSSLTTLAATNFSNEANPLQSIVSLIVSPYMADEDAWVLFADTHNLNWRWRIQPENWSEPNYVNSSVEIGVRFRCAVDALDPRGVVGSQGS